MPANARELVFVGEVVLNFSRKGLLKGMPKPLSKMLIRCHDDQAIIVGSFPAHDSRQRVILHCTLGFVSQETFDLSSVRGKKPALQVYVATCDACLCLPARMTNSRLCWEPFLSVGVHLRICGDPSFPGVHGAALAAYPWFDGVPSCTMPPPIVIDALRKRSIGVFLLAVHR